jgi:hypothetical protein
MKAETPEQKFNRLQKQIQNLVLKGYPNPAREGCPGDAVVANYARRVAAGEETEREPDYEHITHCSPCYREFLDTRDRLRGEEGQAKPGKRMSWFTRRRLGRNLDKLENVMESAAREVLKMRETRR